MKMQLLLLAFIAGAGAAGAQIKIGSNPGIIDPASVLELEGSGKAFYNVRVSLSSTTDLTTVPNPKAGMEVYNTNAGIAGTAANPAIPGGIGKYYFDGSRWVGTGATASSDCFVLTNSNFASTAVPAGSCVRIRGTITLNYNYGGLSSNHISISGGTINGNSSATFMCGSHCLFENVTFNNVDLSGNEATFVNCTFSGSCPRLGTNGRFVGCEFSGVTTGSAAYISSISNSTMTYCDFPRIYSVQHSQIDHSTIESGGLTIIGCDIFQSFVKSFENYFIFTGNHCANSSIQLSDPNVACEHATISNNQFASGYSSTTAPINIDPTTSTPKLYTIENNVFTMQNTDVCSIRITSGTNGSPLSNIAVKGNTFRRGSHGKPIFYQSTINIDYTGNTALELSNNTSTGNLTASSPNFQHP